MMDFQQQLTASVALGRQRMRERPATANDTCRLRGSKAIGRTLGIIVGALFLATCADVNRAGKITSPNVLLLIVDDLGDWVGCLDGHPDARTPNIDALAGAGVLFTNAHAQAPICNPSRTSLLLGLRPSTLGIYKNEPGFRDVPGLSDRMTLFEYFAKQGYRTLGTGKIFHDQKTGAKTIQVMGPTPGQRSPLDVRVRTRARRGLWDFGAQDYDEAEYVDAQCVSWAVERLAEKSDRPFFLTVGLYRPHMPLYAPRRLFDSGKEVPRRPPILENDRDDLPPPALALGNELSIGDDWFRKKDRAVSITKAYLAATTFVDEQIGRLLQALDESAYADNTVIVLLSDHGMQLGEKENWGKETLWERSTHVPFIFSFPGGENTVPIDRPVELVSLFPTLVELCGLRQPVEVDFDGPSLLPLIENPESCWDHPAITSLSDNAHTVRTDRWRYIRYADGSEELYDHENDPNEWANLAVDESHKAKLVELASLLPENAAPDAANR